MKKAAFTLAEVLIVLVILGVIASMTVPSLMTNSNQTVYITGVKKAMATLNNAIQLASIDSGQTPSGQLGLNSIINNVFAPTLKISKVFQNGFQTQDGMIFYFFNHKANGICQDLPTNLADIGESADDATGACAVIVADVNGLKGPNFVTDSNTKAQINDLFVLFLYRNAVTGGPYAAGAILSDVFVEDATVTNTASGLIPAAAQLKTFPQVVTLANAAAQQQFYTGTLRANMYDAVVNGN